MCYVTCVLRELVPLLTVFSGAVSCQIATTELGTGHALVESVSSALSVARRAAQKVGKRPAPLSDLMHDTGSVMSDYPMTESPTASRATGVSLYGSPRDERGLPGIAPRTPMSTVSDSARPSKRLPAGDAEELRLPAVTGGGANATWSPAGGLAINPIPSPPSQPRSSRNLLARSGSKDA